MPLYSLTGQVPRIAADAFIAPGAQVVGDVEIGAGSSVWFNCVLRGDGHYIRVGKGTNIQDGTVVHTGTGVHPALIGDDVLIGHLAMIHGCVLENHTLVGLGSIIMDGCVIEEGGMLAAGAMLTPGKRIGRAQLWMGRPAVYVRDLSPEDLARHRQGTAEYAERAQRYRAQLKPLD